MRNKQKYLSLSLFAALTCVIVTASGCGDDTNNTPTGAPTAPGTTETVVTIAPGAVGKGPAAYGTNPLMISPGTTVQWVNQDSVEHTATSDSGVFDSGTLTTGETYTFKFDNPGTYPYHCEIHGAASMSGVIQVGASPSPSISPSTAPSPSPSVSPMPSPTPTMSPYPIPTISPTVMPSMGPMSTVRVR